LQPPESAISPDDILRLQKHVRDVPIARHVRSAVARFVRSTIPELAPASSEVARYVRFGISPRGGQAMVLAAKARALVEGRFNVSFEDLRFVLLPALRHRFQLNYQGLADGISVERVLSELFEKQARAALAE